MNYLIGIVAALGLMWVSTKLGELVRDYTNGGLNRFAAMAVGVVTGMGLWYGLRYGTDLAKPVVDAIALGPAVGLTQGLTRLDPEKK